MKTNKSRFGAGYLILAAFGLALSLIACTSSPQAPAPSPAGTVNPPAPSGVPAPAPAATAAPTAAAAPSDAVSGGEIEVTLRENEFPEEIRVKAGTKVVFVITNRGREAHTFEAPDVGIREEIKPRKTIRIEWTAPDTKGSWDVGCYLTEPEGVHDGMEGFLIIE